MTSNIRVARAASRLQRRLFLQALGLGLAVPTALKLARSALAAPPTAQKRFFLMYMPHGVAPEHYNPQVMGGDNTNFVLNDTNVSILGPLEPYKSYVNVYQGFKYPGGSTHTGIVSCLSGVDGGGTPETTSPRTTLEQVIAQGLGVKATVLGACSHQPYGLDDNGKLFWNGTAIDPQKNPASAADSLFANLIAPTAGPNPDVQLRSDLLGLTVAEIQALQGTLGNLTTEQTKLQRHLEAIQGMQGAAGGGGGPLACTTRPAMPTVEQVRAASAGQVVDPSGGNDYFYQEKNFPLIFQAQLELVAQALICNVSQVMGLMPMYATCDFDFSFSQQAGAGAPSSGWAHHAGLSHTGYQAANGAQYNSPISVANFNPTTRAAFAGAQLWFAQQLVKYVVQVLATTPDPSAPGSMVLDNTLIYWMSEIGDGAGHTTASAIEYPQVPAYLPLVTIGKAGGALKTGQIINYGTAGDSAGVIATDRPAGDLYLSLAKAMGVANPTFPDATGPVTEVLT
jgi:hypothetical protein